ncbi:MAG: VWA domain-containing protein [Acidobacteria bacterium]|nr:VWA domain-containing protein [Acidobacteriota bacterium]
MKNLTAIIIAVFLVFALTLTAFTQEPTKPTGQQPPSQQQKQDPTRPKPTEQKEPEEQDQKPFVIPTTQVVVPVIITDAYGNFVTGLKKNDFLLREDGAVQEIEQFDDERSPFSVALVLDLSLSTRNKLDDIKRTAIEFVKQLQPRDKVLIVAFNEKVEFIGDFTDNQKELESNIKKLKSGYLTSIYDAIDQTIREKLLKAPGRKAMVVLSDGVDTGSKRATYDGVLELITRAGIVSYAVRYETRNDGGKKNLKPEDLPRLGTPFTNSFVSPSQAQVYQKQKPKDRDLVGIDFLRELADRSGARYLRSETAEGTAFMLKIIANEIRNQYTLAYSPTNPSEDGKFRQIMVNLKRNDILIRARQGYYAPKPQEAKEPEKPKE